jgi:hypothetical protein
VTFLHTALEFELWRVTTYGPAHYLLRAALRHEWVSEAYRCYVCYLDLRFDPLTSSLVIAPFGK